MGGEVKIGGRALPVDHEAPQREQTIASQQPAAVPADQVAPAGQAAARVLQKKNTTVQRPALAAGLEHPNAGAFPKADPTRDDHYLYEVSIDAAKLAETGDSAWKALSPEGEVFFTFDDRPVTETRTAADGRAISFAEAESFVLHPRHIDVDEGVARFVVQAWDRDPTALEHLRDFVIEIPLARFRGDSVETTKSTVDGVTMTMRRRLLEKKEVPRAFYRRHTDMPSLTAAWAEQQQRIGIATNAVRSLEMHLPPSETESLVMRGHHAVEAVDSSLVEYRALRSRFNARIAQLVTESSLSSTRGVAYLAGMVTPEPDEVARALFDGLEKIPSEVETTSRLQDLREGVSARLLRLRDVIRSMPDGPTRASLTAEYERTVGRLGGQRIALTHWTEGDDPVPLLTSPQRFAP